MVEQCVSTYVYSSSFSFLWCVRRDSLFFQSILQLTYVWCIPIQFDAQQSIFVCKIAVLLSDIASYQQALDKMLLSKIIASYDYLWIKQFDRLPHPFYLQSGLAQCLTLYICCPLASILSFVSGCYVLTNSSVDEKNVLTHVCTSPCCNLLEVNRKLHFIVFKQYCVSRLLPGNLLLLYMYVWKFISPLPFYPIISNISSCH
jgi:hypothetical protein